MNQTAKNPLRKQRWPRWGTDVLVILIVFIAVRAYQQRDAIEGQAPRLRGNNLLDGSVVELSAFRGKPVLLHFWASWCGVCKACQHNVTAVAKDHAVITVATQSGPPQAVRDYLGEHPIGAPVVLDDLGVLAQQFGVRAFPTTFIIDASGNISHVEVGYSSELGLRLRLWLAAL